MKTEFKFPVMIENERIIEVPFFVAVIRNFCKNRGNNDPRADLLDVGGKNSGFINKVGDMVNYYCCDLDCGEFRGDFNTYDFRGRKFDIVTALSSLEHFGNFENNADFVACKKIKTLLNPDGIFVLSVPAGRLYHDPEHFYGFIHYDQDRLHRLASESGLELIEERYFKYKKDHFEEVEYNEIRYISYWDNGAPNACGLFCGVYR